MLGQVICLSVFHAVKNKFEFFMKNLIFYFT